MSALSLFVFIIGIFWFTVFWFLKINSKWAFLVACMMLLTDPLFLFFRIPILNNEINMLGLLFFTIGFILIFFNRDIPPNFFQEKINP